MKHIGTQRIETERLILRRYVIEDAADAYKNWFSDPVVAEYMQWDADTDVSQTEEHIKQLIIDYEKPDFYRWAIALKDSNEVIGAIGISNINENDRIASVAYALSKNYWNKGYISEALTAVLRYALIDMGLNRVEAYHTVSNPASGKVMQKAGMTFEGRARQKYRSHKGFEDSDMYAILREDIIK